MNHVLFQGPRFGVRHVQILFLFVSCILRFYVRTYTAVGIVAMTNSNTTNPDFQELDWSEEEKSYVLSSIFWGSTCSQFFGGYLSIKCGSKQLLQVCTLGMSVLGFLIPTAATYGGWQSFCAIRVLQGIFESIMLSCSCSHMTKWSPVSERNRLGGIIEIGIDLGCILGSAVSGFAATSAFGWPAIYYIPSVIGILWCILWNYFGSNSPSESKIISPAERNMIQLSLENTVSSSVRNKPIPWRAICTSVPFLALLVVRISLAAYSFTLGQQMPSYFHNIFNTSIEMNAIYSAIPYILPIIFSFVFLLIADVLTHRYNVSLAIVRKTLNSLCCWVPTIALLALAYVSAEDLTTSVTLLIIAISMISAQTIGSFLNHIDLSPNYVGVLLGISTTFANFGGILSPLLVGIVASDKDDGSQWKTVFTAIAVILFFGNLLYVLFGKMEIQPWNEWSDKKPGATQKIPSPTINTSYF